MIHAQAINQKFNCRARHHGTWAVPTSSVHHTVMVGLFRSFWKKEKLCMTFPTKFHFGTPMCLFCLVSAVCKLPRQKTFEGKKRRDYLLPICCWIELLVASLLAYFSWSGYIVYIKTKNLFFKKTWILCWCTIRLIIRPLRTALNWNNTCHDDHG